MRKVDRSLVAEPLGLHARRRTDKSTELERATRHYGDPAKTGSYDFEAYGHATVKTSLHLLFHGKCAYCESPFGHLHPVDVEHYRPKSAVAGALGHRGYWWLAMEWDNLLPSCIDCNRKREQKVPRGGHLPTLLAGGEFDRSVSLQSGKDTLFPLAGGTRAVDPTSDIASEVRLLLDPTRDDPDEHLSFHVDGANPVALVYPAPSAPAVPTQMLNPELPADDLAAAAMAENVSPMGAVSIQVYGLNRLGLVQARTKLLRDMEFLFDVAVGLITIAIELEDRIAEREAAGTAAAIAADQAFDRRIVRKLRRYSQDIFIRLRQLTSDDAPYSRLARTWVATYLSGR